MEGDGKLESKEYVEYLLKNYHQIKRDIEVLKVLLEIRIYESDDEIIEEMNFETFKGEKMKHRNIADKTANIAMGYKDKREKQESDRIKELKKEIIKKEMGLLKLETSVGILETPIQRVIRGLYFEDKSMVQLSRELYVSEGTLWRWRKKGVGKIAALIN